MSLSKVLLEAGLTTLSLQRSGEELLCTLSRDWDPDQDFSAYGRRWSSDQLVCREPRALGDSEARELLRSRGELSALEGLERGMRQGRHESFVMRRHAKLGVEVCHFIHSSALGRQNGFHALRAGGMRRHAETAPEAEVLADGLNLSRAMSFKCAAAGMPFGGSKSTLVAPHFGPDSLEHVGFIAYSIDAGQLMTGPDVGLAPELLDAFARHSPHVLCGSSSPLGQTGGPTATGVLAALGRAAEHRFGIKSLAGRRVAIQGLGSVGLQLAVELARQGAHVIAADVDAARVALCRESVPALEAVQADSIVGCECDVFAPCALGGVLSAESIGRLRTSMVYGAANNQLAAATSEGELELAELLAARGILFQPDWTYTMGGILTGYEVYRKRDLSSFAAVRTEIERAAGDGTRDLLNEAAATGETPTRVALRWYSPLVYGSPE